MEIQIDIILDEFKDEITEIEKGNLNDFSTVEKCIQVSRKCIQDLRVMLRNNEFETTEDEIRFFKYSKPEVYSKIIFYSKLYQFLLKKPQGTIKKQRKFIDEEIDKLQGNLKENLEFVKYYREGISLFDKYYFLRGKDEFKLATADASQYLVDKEFATSHDQEVAKIMAYDLLVNHYQQQLEELRLRESRSSQNPYSALANYTRRGFKWTGSKTDLVELLYAFSALSVIDAGTADIKAMVEACEELFEIELGNAYRTYLAIKDRKKDRTKFLDELKVALLRKMEREEL